MPTAVIESHVKDYATWKSHYDQHQPMRVKGGATNDRVYQSPTDPSRVCVLMDFPSLRQAETFLHGSDLRQAMEEAGVIGAPRITIAGETPLPTP